MRKISVSDSSQQSYRAPLTLADVIVLTSMGEEVAIDAKEASRA